MSLGLVVVVAGLVVGVGAVIALVLALVPTRAAGEAVPVRVRRRLVVWRWVGAGLGVAAAVTASATGALGRGLMLAVPLFGLFLVLGVLAGELSVSAPSGPTRRASLDPRRLGDYLPRALTAAVVTATAALAGLLVTTTLLGSPDDLGRNGRWLSARCGMDGSEGHGPWPGSYYAVPLAAVVILGLVAVAVTLHRVVRRPRPGDPVALAASDDLLRRRAARVAVGGWGVLVTIPLVGISVVAGAGLRAVSCGPDWWDTLAGVTTALVPVWVVVLIWSASTVVLTRPVVATGGAADGSTVGAGTSGGVIPGAGGPGGTGAEVNTPGAGR